MAHGEILMGIDEVNKKLILIGNAMIIRENNMFYVVPRTTVNVCENLMYHEGKQTVYEAYLYAEKLPNDWKMH